MRYLIVLSAAGYQTSPGHVAMESALVEHLHRLKVQLGARFAEIDVAMPAMTPAQYAEQRGSMTIIDEDADGIRFVPLYTWRASKARFMAESPAIFARLVRLVAHADFVHSHLSYDLWRPVELVATMVAVAMRKKVISITDMDNRGDADMNYALGRWSFRAWALCKLVYDPMRDLQQRALVRACDMVLFKEAGQVKDYGHGAANVRLFLDPNFAAEHIAPPHAVARKLRELHDVKVPLKVLYFGRLVAYKGVDKMIEAVARARTGGAHIRLSILGSGPEEASLRALTTKLGADDIVEWLPPCAYGPALFAVLRDRHVLLACPLSADTPRSTWDALASGMPLLAFDTPFYAGVADYTGAVTMTRWPEVEPLAARLIALAADKTLLVPLVKHAVAAARANTGDAWLKRRAAWVDELFDDVATVHAAGAAQSVTHDRHAVAGVATRTTVSLAA